MFCFLLFLMLTDTISLTDLPVYSPFAVRFQALEDGRSVLLDRDECKLHFFDNKGHLEKIVGDCGSGPHSFDSPHSIKLVGEVLYVYQSHFYTAIHPDSGQVIEKNRILEPDLSFNKVKNGWVASPNRYLWKALKEIPVKWYSTDFLEEKELYLLKGNDTARAQNSRRISAFQEHPIMVVDDTGNFLYLRDSGTSTIKVFNIGAMAFSPEIRLNLKRVPLDKDYFEEWAAGLKKLPNSTNAAIKAPDYYPIISRIIPLHGGGILVVSADGPARTCHAMNHTGKTIHTPITPELYPRILSKKEGFYWIMSFDGDEVSIHKIKESRLLENLKSFPYEKPSLDYFLNPK